MVGMMAVNSKEKAADLLSSAKFSSEIPSKLKYLRLLKELLLQLEPLLLPEFVPRLMDLQADRSSPVRKFLVELIGEIGSRDLEFVPEMVPVLISFLKDDTPAVARQAIATGTDLFRRTLEKVAIQGLFSSELDNSLESSWTWMLKFKDTILPIAFQPGSDGVRLLAVKFVEAMILLYTPDPNGSSQPPPNLAFDGEVVGFDMSWLRGGHPLLDAVQLAVEASQSLGLLLDQLKFPYRKSQSNSIIIVLINSLSAIAKKRPAYYGRILPVLLGLDPSSSVTKGLQVSGANRALKNAFLSCLNCIHRGAAPWRNRLIDALKGMNGEEIVEHSICKSDQVSEIVVQTSGELYPSKEETVVVNASDAAEGRKRLGVQESRELDSEPSGKRVRSTLIEGSTNESLQTDTNLTCNSLPLTGSTTSTRSGDSEKVQQLVAFFGALVAQGDKAALSLDILISSISSDLLAEVVMANMRYLPPTCPKAEEEELVGSSAPAVQSSSFVSNILSLLSPQVSAAHDTSQLIGKVEQPDTFTVVAGGSAPGTALVFHEMEKDESTILSDINDVDNLGSEIPGLEHLVHTTEMQDTEVSLSSTVDTQDTNHDQVTFPGSCRSEGNSPKVATTDSNFASISSQCVLPKMSAPVVDVSDEEKDNLQKLVFSRIVEVYKQIAVAGGSHIRFSLLAFLGAEYPLELDSWELLQNHILSDYLNHEGHELTLRVLYSLYKEAEQDQDFFSSTNATSIYDKFLLAVAETLRDSFPPSDKSLSRLLGEVPYLPSTTFKLLERLCSPGPNEKGGKGPPNGDRVTQGLSAVWSLILQRPPIRDACLKIALQSTVHHLEEVRMKAIRLVANKLYPMPCISKKIEDFANEMLFSVVKNAHALEGTDAEELSNAVQKEVDVERLSSGVQPSGNASDKELFSDATRPLSSIQSVSSSAALDAQRCMSLYFALCTKKHSLLRQIFTFYESLSKAVKQAVDRHIPILVRTIGCSSELLAIISNPPNGSQSLLMQILHTLTDGTTPSSELVFTVRKLYDSKLKDVEILIPILTSLSKDEVLPIFPQIVNLPLDKFQAAVSRLLQGSPQTGPSLTPTELLIAIHGIDPERDGIPLKKVTDACSSCFDQRQVFTQQVYAKALNQLVEQIPPPLLFMRTVIQAIGVFPALVDFIMEILARLVSKQIWKYPKLWVGFLKCTVQTQPQSFSVLLQLPAAQLESALNKKPMLKPPLVSYANRPNIRSSLPRSTLVVLGLVQELPSQASTQVQPVELANSAEAATEITRESSAVS